MAARRKVPAAVLAVALALGASAAAGACSPDEEGKPPAPPEQRVPDKADNPGAPRGGTDSGDEGTGEGEGGRESTP